MATGLQFIIFVTFACIICNTGAQEIFGKYLENLKKNMAILNKEKNTNDKYDYDYDEDDYFYDDKEDNEPTTPPSPPTKGSGRSKTSPKGNSEAGNGKKHAGPNKVEAGPRPSDKGVGFRFASDPDGPETVQVLSVKKFMFQAQPVFPVGKKTPETTKIYYYV